MWFNVLQMYILSMANQNVKTGALGALRQEKYLSLGSNRVRLEPKCSAARVVRGLEIRAIVYKNQDDDQTRRVCTY